MTGHPENKTMNVVTTTESKSTERKQTMRMRTNNTQGETQMTRTARFTRLVAIAGMASLAATILTPNTHADMMPGAIGNDGANGFDGSITAKSRHWQDAGRETQFMINGAGLTAATGLHATSGHWLSDFHFNGTNLQNPMWVIIDLGATYPLARADFWAYSQGADENRGIKTADIWYAAGPTEPNANNTDWNLADFDSTGWTPFQSGYGFNMASEDTTTTIPLTQTIPLDSILARFVALDISANHSLGNSSFAAVSELQFFAVPEPSTFALLALGGLAFSRIRRRRK